MLELMLGKDLVNMLNTDDLLACDPGCLIKINEPLSQYTTFKIGGNADYVVEPSCIAGVIEILHQCKNGNVPYVVLGNGSNVLISDSGIRGVIVRLAENFSSLEQSEEVLIVSSGILLSQIAQHAKKANLTGFEFASGIPGTLGGAVFMNAGAYGGEMKDVVLWCEALTPEGDVVRLAPEEMAFGYRTSLFKTQDLIILRCALKLAYGHKDDIESIMVELTERRVSKQPLELPSAGSTFKRPVGYFAGQLIETSGLRGLTYGGAQVSQKHCGFVVNVGGATCKDVLTLNKMIQKIVYDTHGVWLEREVRIIGDPMG
jgi:UDP-N-acetylmuramate dehydrogenase